MWLILSISTAFFEATKDLFGKKGLLKADEYLVSWGLRFFSLPFLLPLLFFFPMPELDANFWWALLGSGTLNVLTTLWYIKGIKLSPLSIASPMLTFTPLFLLITSPLILKESPNLFGVLGVLLIVFGAYFVNMSKFQQKDFLAPFKSLAKEKGALLMLAVAFIWSITSNIDKIGVQHSSPIFWVIITNIYLSLIFSVILLFRSRKNLLTDISSNVKSLLPVGLFSALALICQMTAINMMLVAYVISIKRMSVIISSLYGFFVFKEKFLKTRLLGVCIMVAGVFLITLF